MTSNETVNDIFLNYLSNQSGISFGDSLLFWVAGLVLAMIIYLSLSAFTDFSKSVIIILAILPTMLFDLIISFGTYTFSLPLLGVYEIHNLVMTLSMVDWIFGFQLFNPGKDIMLTYTTSTAGTTILISLIAFVLSLGDSIFQIVLFSLTFYYIISLVEFKFNMEFEYQRIVSFVCGLIPVSIYALLFSNPFHEFEEASVQATNLLNFFDKAQFTEVIFVMMLGFIAFLLVFIIISIIARFLLSAAISVSPKMQQQLWTTNYASVAFLLTLLYGFLYVMHPDYKWYMILLVILTWKLFRGMMRDISTDAKIRTNERSLMNKQAQIIVEEMNKGTSMQNKNVNQVSHENKQEKFYLEIGLTVLAVIILIIGILKFIGGI